MPKGTRAIVLDASAEGFEPIRDVLTAWGFAEVGYARSVAEARRVMKSGAARLFVVSIDGRRGPELVEALRREYPEVPVIVVGPEGSPDLIVRSVRAGANEYVLRPKLDPTLVQALGRALKGQGGGRGSGKVIAVYGAKGGLGSTTVAVNLAYALSQLDSGTRVALVDLVVQGGDLRVFLSVKPRYTIKDLVERADKLDAAELDSLLHRVGDRLWVCPDPNLQEEAELIDGTRVARVLERLAESFQYVVLDCSHTLNDATLAALDFADTVLVLTELRLPAVRSLQRTLDLLSRLGYPAQKIAVVVNRYGSVADLNVSDLQDVIAVPVTATLPNDYRVTIQATARGRPVHELDPRSKIARGLTTLAAQLNGAPVGAGRRSGRSWLRGVFHRKRKV